MSNHESTNPPGPTGTLLIDRQGISLPPEIKDPAASHAPIFHFKSDSPAPLTASQWADIFAEGMAAFMDAWRTGTPPGHVVIILGAEDDFVLAKESEDRAPVDGCSSTYISSQEFLSHAILSFRYGR